MHLGGRWLLGLALVPYGFLLAAPTTPQAQKVDFAKEILPILRANCFPCHGQDIQMAGLRFDTREGLLKGGASGKVIVPKDSAKSLLMARVLGSDGKTRMPMGFAPLPQAKTDLIKRWIDEGADVGEEPALHWAYVAPKRPPLPSIKDPWIRSEIDAFVIEKMRANGLRPNPAAPRETLIRRVSLDLTGLPPTLAQIDAFLADKGADAYAKLVDRLLASPRYGEHMAAKWLDLARYADTNGYEKDERRTMWPYRDWVIDAFNRDMPYNRFTELQIAGDLVPGAGIEGKIATGFQRNTMFNAEGGVDKEEQRWLTLVDRVATTGTVWLGTTLGCAQCHDHKFDPISTKEFYQFLAYYDNSDEPTLELPSAEADKRRETLSAQIAQTEAAALDEEGKKKLAALKQELANTHGPTTLVLAEKDGLAQTPMRIKGTYLAKGPIVDAGVPAVFPPLPAGAPNNRLGLAKWIANDANPVTARVMVNRLWERVFGLGLVAISEDFGSQTSPPTHPELLDWMSTEFMRDGWSIKRAVRRIVMSATYQQSARATADKIAADADNRWLSRGPRFRMEAEVVRDSALSAAGLLSAKIGGPSVFPDQPEGIWSSPYSGDKWSPSSGEDRWRRGVYTFLKRTAPYPMFLVFDTTSRETCTVRRDRTNTPLQALATLNDTVFVEAAKALAARMETEAPAGAGGKVTFGFRLATSRKPLAAEVRSLVRLFTEQLRRYAKDPDAAKALAGSPEHAAWTVVANVLLNLDEALTKG